MFTLAWNAALLTAWLLQPPTAAAVLGRYVEALGGESALRAIDSRITEGEFDNGRGLKTRFRTYQRAPNKRVTLIGSDAIDSDGGSGRGFDGTTGWDKNFIGTGLRTVVGAELVALGREADLLRPLHWLDECQSTSVEPNDAADVVTCRIDSTSTIRLVFDRRSGLLSEQETLDGRSTRILFEDYRLIDGVRLPYRTRIMLPGASVVYAINSVRHGQAIDERVFRSPRP